jgi:chemotaxis protein CheD
MQKINVVQGEYHVTAKPDICLSTILGSCVAACVRDVDIGVGGMNHFLLPGDSSTDGLRYGVQSMELLINALLRAGARRDRLEAKLFGGARIVAGLSDIGAQNVKFAQRFLADEGIAYVGGSLGGTQARRIQYWPYDGRARQTFIGESAAHVVEAERRRPLPVAEPSSGALELF